MNVLACLCAVTLPSLDALAAKNVAAFRALLWISKQVLADLADEVVDQVRIAIELDPLQ